MLLNLSPVLCDLTQRRALSADAVSKGEILGVLQPPGRITGLTGPISFAHEGSAVVKQLTTGLQCTIDLREPSLLSRGRKHEVCCRNSVTICFLAAMCRASIHISRIRLLDMGQIFTVLARHCKYLCLQHFLGQT